MYSLSFPFFFGTNSIKYPTNNCDGLIRFNLRFSYTNSFSAWCSIFISLYIKKNLRLIPSSKSIM